MAILFFQGRNSVGHFAFSAESQTSEGTFHHTLLSQDGSRVACNCTACRFHENVDLQGWLTVSRADVLAGKVKKCCWHLKRAARVAPLVTSGHVLRRDVQA